MKAFDALLKLLAISLNENGRTQEEIQAELDAFTGDISDSEWQKIAMLAKKDSVASLLYDTFGRIATVPEKAYKEIETYSRSICFSNYRFLTIDIWLDKLLTKAGIPFCIMKGVAAAADYKVPDLRKAGDIDILLTNPADIDKAVVEAEKLGFVKEEEQYTNHHVRMTNRTNQKLEVHTMLAEPFDNSKINAYLDGLIPECGRRTVRKVIMGTELPVLDDAFHAFELLIHMLQHFLSAGFGIKLLCDWVVLWNRGLSDEACSTYMRLVSDCGVKNFSDIVTRTCIKYLGLNREKVLWMKPFDDERSREELEKETELFLEELRDAGEFGKARDRVVALNGSGPLAYVREFHHQMHLNFPKAGKVFLFWPVLWIITLVRFMRNNKKVRSVSSKEVLASAGKRGKLVKRMKLFQ